MRHFFQSPLGYATIIVMILLFEFYGYVAVRTATRRWKKSRRTFITLCYIVVSASFWLLMSNIRSVIHAQPDSFWGKYAVAILMGFFVFKLIITGFLFLGDIYRLVIWITRKIQSKRNPPQEDQEELSPLGISRSRFLSQMSILVGGLMFGTMLYGTRNKYNYRVRRHRLWFPNLPPAFSGLKVVQISDIHSGSFDSPADVARGVQMILDEKPDLILFTGDIVNEVNTELIPYKEIFSRLKAPLGVFAVLGNHDYGDYHEWTSEDEKRHNLQQLKQHIADMGWELLMNQHVVFDKYGERIALIGVENWSAKPQFPKYGKLDQAMEGLEQKNASFQILMSHDPSHWDAEVRPKYPNIDLTLSGHTHGMQFGVNLPWLKFSPVQMSYKQWLGMYQEGKQLLYVNAGYGFIGYKGRVGILPEITVFELMHG